MKKSFVFLVLAILSGACARNYEDCDCTMPMTNNPNIINMRQSSPMPGLSM